VTIEILDASGATVNSYNSDAPAGGGRGRGGRGGGRGAEPGAAPTTTSMEDQPDPEAGGGGGRGRGGPPPRVTKVDGFNRFTWDVRNSAGVTLPPGSYQARLKAGDSTQTQPLVVKIDPRVAAGGVTVADLKEQFDHNVRMRELTAAANDLAGRVRTAMTGATGDRETKLRAIYEQLISTPDGVRYNKPGLQSHISYLAGMTANVDQKIGRDAIERYQALKKELDALKLEADKVLGSAQ
jgi:hypothetical protein